MRIPRPVENLRAALKVTRRMIVKPLDDAPHDGIYYDEAARKRVHRGAFRLQEWAYRHADDARRLA